MILSAFVAEEIEPFCEIREIPWLFAGSSTLEMLQNLMKRSSWNLKEVWKKMYQITSVVLKDEIKFWLDIFPFKKNQIGSETKI